MTPLEQRILEQVERPTDSLDDTSRQVFEELIRELERGTVRAAEPKDDSWEVRAWVKQGILLGFRLGSMIDYSVGDHFHFRDKSTFPPQDVTQHGVRVVPGGTMVRSGAYVAAGVVIMPPSYINVGAYVDEGSMVDSHALVGSCAQVGRRVHLSAGAQLGGVLEPVGARPVLIEDDVFVGALSGVFEGVRVCKGAVIASGVILTASTPIFDLPNQRWIRSESGHAPEIPENAVVVMGSRPVDSGESGVLLNCPVIVKYRDAGTDERTALEEALR
ncbi:MAG: 2,3,4,5-tetrahydropyridine-2,6-dicarboxylate N-succinyltransferase [Planctomycetota bacterium]